MTSAEVVARAVRRSWERVLNEELDRMMKLWNPAWGTPTVAYGPGGEFDLLGLTTSDRHKETPILVRTEILSVRIHL